jgi:glycosidase
MRKTVTWLGDWFLYGVTALFVLTLVGVLFTHARYFVVDELMRSQDFKGQKRAVDEFEKKLRAVGIAREQFNPSILIRKRNREMLVLSGDIIVATYPVGLGRASIGIKLNGKDQKTPEGQYYICDKDRDFRFHLFLRLNYPSPDDAKRGSVQQIVRPSEEATITEAWEKNLCPPTDTALGGPLAFMALALNHHGLLTAVSPCITSISRNYSGISALEPRLRLFPEAVQRKAKMKKSGFTSAVIAVGMFFAGINSPALPQEQALPRDFSQERIYSVIISRFYDGDNENNFYNRERIEKGDPHFRGDLKGLTRRLDYIRDLGFTAVCVTPPVENRGGLDFMGFNAYDWEKIDPRIASADFSWQDFVRAAKDLGLKVIQTVVVNHCSNYGIRNHYFISRLPLKFYRGPIKPQWPYIFNLGNYRHEFRMDNDNPCAPEWFKDYRYRDPWGAGPLKDPVTGAVFPGENLHPERFFATDEKTLDSQWFHRDGWLTSDNMLIPTKVQRCHLDQNSIDLATENWKIKHFFHDVMKKYVAMGVDGFRIQFARNVDRQDLIHIVELWRQENPDLYIFADVEPAQDGFGQLNKGREPSQLCPWWYTRRTANQFEPEIAGNSGIAVMDYPLFRQFATSLANGHFAGIGNIVLYDWAYANPLQLVTFFHNYDSGPESGNLTRFSGETWKSACAYNLLWTMRGIPMLLMGEEIEFMKGMPQIPVLPQDRLFGNRKSIFRQQPD